MAIVLDCKMQHFIYNEWAFQHNSSVPTRRKKQKAVVKVNQPDKLFLDQKMSLSV